MEMTNENFTAYLNEINDTIWRYLKLRKYFADDGLPGILVIVTFHHCREIVSCAHDAHVRALRIKCKRSPCIAHRIVNIVNIYESV